MMNLSVWKRRAFVSAVVADGGCMSTRTNRLSKYQEGMENVNTQRASGVEDEE